MQSTRHKSDKMATDPPDEDLTVVGMASNSFIWNPQIMATDQPAAGPCWTASEGIGHPFCHDN
jgi:hypothetical protein